MRPYIVGAALHEIAKEPEIKEGIFQILETQKMLEGDARVTLIPEKSEVLAQFLAAMNSTAPQETQVKTK